MAATITLTGAAVDGVDYTPSAAVVLTAVGVEATPWTGTPARIVLTGVSADGASPDAPIAHIILTRVYAEASRPATASTVNLYQVTPAGLIPYPDAHLYVAHDGVLIGLS